MTLRTIESEFSDILMAQLQEEYPINLRSDGPLMVPLHPKLIWAQLLQKHGAEESQKVTLTDWSFDCFKGMTEAEKKYPEIGHKIVGRPWTIFEFLQGTTSSAFIDFQEWGTVALSKTEEYFYQGGRELHDYALPAWLSYALSPELWGPQGKWIRFHQDLEKTLRKSDLLKVNSTVGKYVLDMKAEKLELHGFKGTKTDHSYVLVLPWSLSLSALKKLIQTIEQEF